MIYAKTAAGLAAFQQRDPRLSARARSILIMIDGKRGVAELQPMLVAIGAGVEQLEELEQAGFIEWVGDAAPTPAPRVTAAQATQAAHAEYAQLDDTERYKTAYPLATALTAGLGLRGFRLNLSVEGAGNLAELKTIAPKIRDAVGEQKFAKLGAVLGL